MPTDELTYLSLCGMLGYGYPEENLQRAMQANPAFIAADNGSTDPGPYYLGSGTGFVRPEQIRRDLELALVAARQANIPLIIGSAGGAGAAPHLAAFRKILLEIAQCHGLRFRLATIPADVDKADVLQALDAGRISPCGPVPPLTAERVRSCSHLVGQMGTGPIIQALRGGADVVVVGRCCDTAIFAALPMMRGFDPALAMHSAKIAECGTLCATPGGANDSLLITLRRDSFTVRPVAPEKRCLPRTVAAHSLYEQPSPHEFIEPEGTVDLRDATFTAEDKRSVRVSGTRLIPPDVHTVKLEGATRVGYRSITLAGTRDPGVIANLDTIEQAVRTKTRAMMTHMPGADSVRLRFLRYGLDGVSEQAAKLSSLPQEVGLLIDAVADTPELADTAVSLARSTALHQPFDGRKTTAGNLAFPFSPSDFRGGEVYEFAVYHLMEVQDEVALFPVHFEEVGS